MNKKTVTVNNQERITLQVIITEEIKSSMASKSLGIEPVFSVKELKDLYKKFAGHEWEE